MGEPQGVGAAAARREESPAERADVILTPDQRVRVFISSTLEELAAERAAARRAIARLHLVPVWYESGARRIPSAQHVPGLPGAKPGFVGIYWRTEPACYAARRHVGARCARQRGPRAGYGARGCLRRPRRAGAASDRLPGPELRQ